MKTRILIASLAYLLIGTLFTSCATRHLPTRGWTIAYIYDNGAGYYTTFLSLPNGCYTLEQQFDSIVGTIGESVILHGTDRITRIERFTN